MHFDMNFAINTFWVAVSGIPVTLLVTGAAFLTGLPLGLILALAKIYRIRFWALVSTVHISFFRGTPLIVQIYLAYTAVPRFLSAAFEATGAGYDIYAINPLWYAFLVFGLNSSAGYAEMWKASLQSVGVGQLEAAHSVGLTTVQGYRHILLPQALVVAAPSICTSTLNLLKGTSLVFVMTVQDITAKAKVAAGVEYKYIEGYVDVFLIYLVVCIVLEQLFKLAERRLTVYRQPV